MDISVTDLKEKLSSPEKVAIIDVREPIEYHTYNIGGINIPLATVQSIDDFNFNKNDEIVVVCQRGIRSKTACKVLRSLGYLNARNLTGGLIAFRKLNDY